MTPMTALMRQYYKGQMFLAGQDFNADEADVPDLVALRMARPSRKNPMAATGRTVQVPSIEKKPITSGNEADEDEDDTLEPAVEAAPAEKHPQIRPTLYAKNNKPGRRQ